MFAKIQGLPLIRGINLKKKNAWNITYQVEKKLKLQVFSKLNADVDVVLLYLIGTNKQIQLCSLRNFQTFRK